MPAQEEPVVFISRDVSPFLAPLRRHVESETPRPHLSERGPGWDEPDDAIAWGRARAAEVYIRLGVTGATYYSAGEVDRPSEAGEDDTSLAPSSERNSSDLQTVSQSPDRLGADDRLIWCEATHELGALRVAEAVEPLLSSLDSEDADAVRAAIVALLDIGDKRAVRPLVAMLDEFEAEDLPSDRIVAAYDAAQALSGFDDPLARDAVSAWRARRGW